MNNRDYKQFAPLACHHIYNRGAGKRDIFLDDNDRLLFLLRLKENLYPDSAIKHGRYIPKILPANAFKLLCYCLMPNHIHLLIQQITALPTSALILKVFTSYSKYFNKKYDRIGPLFQDTYKASLISSDEYLRWISAYIHNNPKTAGIVKELDNYPWSSYLDYVGTRKGILCQKRLILDQFASVNDYKNFVAQAGETIRQRKDLERLLLDA